MRLETKKFVYAFFVAATAALGSLVSISNIDYSPNLAFILFLILTLCLMMSDVVISTNRNKPDKDDLLIRRHRRHVYVTLRKNKKSLEKELKLKKKNYITDCIIHKIFNSHQSKISKLIKSTKFLKNIAYESGAPDNLVRLLNDDIGDLTNYMESLNSECAHTSEYIEPLSRRKRIKYLKKILEAMCQLT